MAVPGDPFVGEIRRLIGLGASLAAAVAWAFLAAGTPTNTYHFAPMVVAGAWVAIDGSLGAGLIQRRSVTTAAAGFGLAAVTIAILAAKGDLDGPTFFDTSSTTAVVIEHVIFAVLGASLGGVYAVRTAAREPRNL